MLRTAIGLADDDDNLPREPIERLLERTYEGDRLAWKELFRRHDRVLRKRAVTWARAQRRMGDHVEMMIAHAVVQVTRQRKPAAPEAIFAFLRHAVWIQIRDQGPGSMPTPELGPEFHRYAWALSRLPKGERKAFTLRFDFEFSYAHIAVALDLPSADAARARVARAVLHLAETMDDPGAAPSDS